MGLTGPNMAVKIGRIEMKNPVTVASGTFGFGQEMSDFYDLGRLGAIVVKGTSLKPWPGNPYPRTVETPSGMLNAIGLQNDGLDSFINEKLPFLRRFDTPVIVNVVGHSVDEYAEIAARLDGVEGVAGLEINISCPNVKEGCLVFGASPEGTAEVVSAVRKRDRPHADNEALAKHRRSGIDSQGGGRCRKRLALAHQHAPRHRNRPLDAQVQAGECHRRIVRPGDQACGAQDGL